MTSPIVNPINALFTDHGAFSRSNGMIALWLAAAASLIIVVYLFIDLLLESIRDRRFQQNMRLWPRGYGMKKYIKPLWRFFLPNLPRPSTFRHRLAEGLLVLLELLSWSACVPVGIIVGWYHGVVGSICGFAAGWFMGIWTRRSLGVRSHDMTHGFFVRMAERGSGDPPRLLESLLEALRGEKLGVHQCRQIADDHAEVFRRLRTCDSPMGFDQILHQANHNLLAVVHGTRRPELFRNLDS